MLHLVTYATHAEGSFEALSASRPDLVVLGWGTRWKGFFDKVDAMQEFVAALPEEDLVLFVDGFDTEVTDTEAVRRYMEETHPRVDVLFSLHVPPLAVPWIADYVVRRQFLGVRNSGLYVGRVRALRRLYAEAQEVREECLGDDQRAFNLVADRHRDDDPEWRTDIRREVLHVLTAFQSTEGVVAGVVHRPGSTGWRRVVRGVREAVPFLHRELMAVAAVGILLLAFCAQS